MILSEMSTPSRFDKINTIPGLSPQGQDTRREIYRNLGVFKLGCMAAPVVVGSLAAVCASPFLWFGAAITGYAGFELWRVADNFQDIYTKYAQPNPAWSRSNSIMLCASGTFVVKTALDTFAPKDFGEHLFPPN
jgi:hypothetical protein